MGHRRTHARSISAEGFALLLRRLDPDPDRGATEYERLRLTLVKFFDWRGAWPPDECADETLDRLVGKLQGETAIEDVRRYAHGIARLVLLERVRQQAETPFGDDSGLSHLQAPAAAAHDPLHECLERCLARLSNKNRELVLDYYAAEGHDRIVNRRRLARSAGISDNALRSRVQRLRDRLERCAESCAGAAATDGLEAALRHVTAIQDTLEEKVSEKKTPDGV